MSERLPSGGAWIDRAAPLRFSFDGRSFTGFAGDSLASALLAADVGVVARSFKYHRPRGTMGLGSEEPSALVTLGSGPRREPNVKATTAPLRDGLVVASQNRWPSLDLDFAAAFGLASPLLEAGFYYKTFMWPRRAWLGYERAIRRVAGLGRAPVDPDPDRYDKCHAFADVLVIGGGPAGLAAALAAGKAGARVILADEQPRFGASLAGAPDRIGDAAADLWVRSTLDELGALPRVTCLPGTTVAGAYDHGFFVLAERLAPTPEGPRERLWKLRARQVVLASGATERPLVFAGNDRPGVMTASAVRGYLRRFGVLCGRRAVVFTNNDSGYATAHALAEAGATVSAVVDPRTSPPAATAAVRAGLTVLAGSLVTGTRGRRRLEGVDVARSGAAGAQRFDCDLLCMSGGWSPNVHLFSQSRGRLRWAEDIAAFVPQEMEGWQVAGAAAGRFGLAACLADGFEAGSRAAHVLGLRPPEIAPPEVVGEEGGPVEPLWLVPGRGSAFVDFQNDVTAHSVFQAAGEGYRSVELLKRYTTLGMGTDQGKLSNINGLALLAHATDRLIPEVGTTTFRPPYTPVTVGAVAARDGGERGHPRRRTAAHADHVRRGALFIEAGEWQRPACYPQPGEDLDSAVRREMAAVRAGVGLVDVSTIGRIDVHGRDAAEFLERAYVNALRAVPAGRGRYGVMLRDDGMVFDDGVVMRLAEDHFTLATSTAQADAVHRHLEFLRQVRCPALHVALTVVTDQWFSAALNGPQSRRVLETLTDLDLDGAAFPLMAIREGCVAGLPARVMRISFSGELAYEISVPADAGEALWNALAEAGRPFGLVLYGVDAMTGLRIEKGHSVVGAEIDGRTTPDDLGLGRMVRKSGDFVGRRSLALPAPPAWGGRQLVGVMGEPGGPAFPPGGHVVRANRGGAPQPSLGHVTSWTWSPSLGRHIGLALLHDGRGLIGQSLYIDAPVSGRTLPVRLADPVFLDPEGRRLRA